ncbi:MAG: DUF4390 domain-containing protein [Chromatiaceae bacterium]
MRTLILAQPAPWGLGLWLTLLLLLPSPGFAKPAFQIEDVKVREVGEELVMDVRFAANLSPVALEALDNGVPLTLEAHIQVRATDAWIWDSSLLDRRLRYSIRYQPLAERYLVAPLPGAGQNYVTRDAAIAALGDLHDLPLLNRGELTAGKDYQIDLMIALDIEELPLPLRPTAYLLPSWKLSSGWTTWPLRP